VANKKKTPQAKPKKKGSNLGYAEPKKANKIARQESLPGIQDRAIKPLENKAFQYAEVRDERIGLSKQEGELKSELLNLMKKYEKTEYHHGAVNISLVMEKENIKVKIKSKDAEEETSFEDPEDEVPEDEEINVTVEA
jgi:hypothetical protein